MRRRIGGLGALALLAVVVAAACGGDDPTPTPVIIEKEVIKEVIVEVTPTPTSAPATPTPTATVDPATLTANLRWMRTGFFTEAVREMLDRGTNGRITLTPEETLGTAAAIDFVRNRPEEHPRTLYTVTEEDILLWQEGGISGINGRPTYDPRPTFVFSQYPAACMNILTLDRNIKTVYDLEGKRMHLGTGVGSSAAWLENMRMVLSAAGVADNMTTLIGGKRALFALQDREVDAITYGLLFADSPSASASPTAHNIAQLTGSMVSVDIPSEVIEMVRADPANKVWLDAGTLNEVKLYPGYANVAFGVDYDIVPREQSCLSGNGVHWATSPEADAETIYQLVRAVLDNRDVGNDYFPFMMPMWGERLGHIWTPQEHFHPGSVRAFDEFGVSYGTPGIREWEVANPPPSS